MATQTTLRNKVSCSGIGLHSGSQVNLSLCPAAANSGIIFKRLDVAHDIAYVAARYDLVRDTRLGTTIANRFGISVSTIEHLMAALWGAGVDNVVVELDGPEVPIMDGSSEPFMFLIECAGIARLAAPRSVLRVLKTIEVREGESVARISPNREGEEGTVISIEIAFDHQSIGRQRSHYDFREVTFKQMLSRARTFGFAHEVEALREKGLARGGSLENAVVLDEDGIINEEGLRYGDEFVRHKALDCVGDLYLAGYRMDAQCTFLRPGHAVNNALLRALFADSSAYEIVEAESIPAPIYSVSAVTAAYA